MNDILNCNQCGKEYKACPKCESNGIFKWRLNFCCINCFKKNMKGELEMITVQYEGKTYGCMEYDFKKGEYLTTNGMKLKEKDIQAFILPIKDFKELKELNMPKKKVVKEETKI